MAAANPDDPRIEITQLKTELGARLRERDELLSRLQTGDQKIAELQQVQSTQTEELGRLRGVEGTVEAVTGERDNLRQQVADLQNQLPVRIQEQVAARLAEVTTAHAAEVAALQTERDQLRARVAELEQPAVESAPAMTTAALAGHFAGVLADLAGQPPTSANAEFTASVTGLSVIAKGLLRATQDGDVELVTPAPGTVTADALSTLNLDVKLLPRLRSGTAAPP